MKPFWRNEPLNEVEWNLFNTVMAAHSRSAFRDNASTSALKISSSSTGSLSRALTAALSTLGGRHAPLTQTYDLLSSEDSLEKASILLNSGQKIPGWGNSFHKSKDPVWIEVDCLLEKQFPEKSAKIDAISSLLQDSGKFVFPNPSCYTAMTAIILGMPKQDSEYLFIAGRLYSWVELFHVHS